MDYIKTTGVLLLIVIGLITVVLQITKVIDILASITDIWIWIAAALIGVSVNLITRTRKQEKENHREPIKAIPSVEFFNSREELRKNYPLNSFFSQAKDKTMILGESLESIALQDRDTFLRLLKQGIHIEFLLLNPEWVPLAKLDKAVAFSGLEVGIKRSLVGLCDMKNELSISDRSRCKIKTYQIQPTYSGIAIDTESSEGKILVESIPYDTDANSRPVIIIHKEENENLFKKWWHGFYFVSNNAEEYTCPKEAKTVKEIGKQMARDNQKSRPNPESNQRKKTE